MLESQTLTFNMKHGYWGDNEWYYLCSWIFLMVLKGIILFSVQYFSACPLIFTSKHKIIFLCESWNCWYNGSLNRSFQFVFSSQEISVTHFWVYNSIRQAMIEAVLFETVRSAQLSKNKANNPVLILIASNHVAASDFWGMAVCPFICRLHAEHIFVMGCRDWENQFSSRSSVTYSWKPVRKV